MEESGLIERLISFGLTRQEAVIYLSLLTHGELTGYEVAKVTGISRSNVYNGLAGLTDKGAAYVMEGSASKYSALNINEFCKNTMRSLEKDSQYLIENAPKVRIVTEGYITIQGYHHIMDKIINMMVSCENRFYLLAPPGILEQLEPSLKKAIDRGIKAVIITDKGYEQNGAIIYETVTIPKQIRFITDSAHVLTGEITGKSEDTCLFSGQENLVTVLKEALKNKITLIKLEKGNEG